VEALTPRERETFRLLGQGRRTAEIAHHLGISFNTARVFIAAVRVKLGCSNIEALRALAARRQV
jgi:DNA-binding CsgD family transcriptional regulator